VLGAAAAVFIVLIAVFIAVQQLNPPDEQQVASAQELYYMLEGDEDTQKIPIDPAVEGVQGDLVISADGEIAILRLAELPQIEENQAYQLWALEDNDVLHSAGLYHWADGHGPYYVELELAKSIDLYQRFGMSIEPEDGSPTPTAGQQIWGLALASSQQ
jgi:anti-sigma-K factor RskA